MSILLLSLGGGGGNILRSLKAMFRSDLLVTQKSDPKYAERSDGRSARGSSTRTSSRCPTCRGKNDS